MKTAKKTLLLALAAVMLVSATVMGTVAYLTSRDSVENTFTVGNVTIKVDEEQVKPDGTSEGTRTEDGNKYHLIPGQTYTKDPTMTVVKGSEEAYVRMLVTINNYTQLLDAFGTGFLPQYYVEGWNPAVWVPETTIAVDKTANTATYEFRYYKTVDASQATEDMKLEPLFTSFTLPGTVTGEQLKEIQGLKITAIGEAIQKATFTSEEVAWAAFEDQMNP